MGRRGPLPKPDAAEVFSIRLRPDVRKHLEEALAKRNGKSISEEIDRRLRRSFSADDDITKRFFTKPT